MTRKLKGKQPFETEISIDETDTETTLEAQILISAELKGMGVEFVGLSRLFDGSRVPAEGCAHENVRCRCADGGRRRFAGAGVRES